MGTRGRAAPQAQQGGRGTGAGIRRQASGSGGRPQLQAAIICEKEGVCGGDSAKPGGRRQVQGMKISKERPKRTDRRAAGGGEGASGGLRQRRRGRCRLSRGRGGLLAPSPPRHRLMPFF
jgi:hypothetical protein